MLTYLINRLMGRQSSHHMLEPGAQAPSFELKSLSGSSESSTGLLRRGPVLLFFFKVSCPVCQMTAPFIERLSKGAGLQVVGVSQDDKDSTLSFNRRFSVTFPVLLDEKSAQYPASNGFGISNVPSLFVVDPSGKVETAFSGFSKRDLEALGQSSGVAVFQPDESVPAFRAG